MPLWVWEIFVRCNIDCRVWPVRTGVLKGNESTVLSDIMPFLQRDIIFFTFYFMFVFLYSWALLKSSKALRVRLIFLLFCRLKKGKELRKEADIREVEKNIHLIKSPAGRLYRFYHECTVHLKSQGSFFCWSALHTCTL